MSAPKLTKKITEKVRLLVESGLTWKKIAQLVGVSESTLHNWRREGGEKYNREFAEMVNLAIEDRDTGRIKANQVVEADKHKIVKVTKELKDKGPKMPPSWFSKFYIVIYANEVLDLELDPRLTRNDMRAECQFRVNAMAKEEMVVTKKEVAEVGANQAAVKNVLTNTGRKDKRWNFKDEMEHSVDDPLSALLAEVAGQKPGLPSEEPIRVRRDDDFL